MKHEKVYIESPYAANQHGTLEENIKYAKYCMKDCLERGEYPLASHLLYPGVLDDDIKDDRKLGMMAGRAWARQAQRIAVYTDLTITVGMEWGIRWAEESGIPLEYRSLEDEENPEPRA